MELHLDRSLSDMRIFPAIDITKSGTRKEELLLTEDEIKAEYLLRRAFAKLGTSSTNPSLQAMKIMQGRMEKDETNEKLVKTILLNDKKREEEVTSGVPSGAEAKEPAPKLQTEPEKPKIKIVRDDALGFANKGRGRPPKAAEKATEEATEEVNADDMISLAEKTTEETAPDFSIGTLFSENNLQPQPT